jgi:hypothetical protein
VDQNATHVYPDLPPYDGKRGVVVLKLESNRGTGGDVVTNLVILSQNPDDPNDPMYALNNNIVKIRIVGGGISKETAAGYV